MREQNNKADQNNSFNAEDTKALFNRLKAEDKEKINSLLNDKSALEEILKSPKAKALMEKIFGNKNG